MDTLSSKELYFLILLLVRLYPDQTVGMLDSLTVQPEKEAFHKDLVVLLHRICKRLQQEVASWWHYK